MKLHTLKPAKGSIKNKKRLGRGEGSGLGVTAGRGNNGAKSRSGYKQRTGFEGGQLPLQRRLPKFGFTSPNRKIYIGINLNRLVLLSQAQNLETITLEDLKRYGFIKNKERVKILNEVDDFKLTLKVEAHAFSKSAKAQIENKGGEAVLITYKK